MAGAARQYFVTSSLSTFFSFSRPFGLVTNYTAPRFFAR